MDPDQKRTYFLARVYMYLGLLACLWVVISRLSAVLAPVGVALVIAFLLDPSVRALETRGVPRWLAVLLLVLVFLGFLTVLVVALPSLVAKDLERFTERLPYYQEVMSRRVLPWIAKLTRERRLADVHQWSLLFSDRLGEWLRGAAGHITAAVQSALLGVVGILRVTISVLLVPLFAVSFLMNMPKLQLAVARLVPPRHHKLVRDVAEDLQSALGGWLRGQLTVMLIQATLYSIGLSLAGIPLAVVIGCTAGVLAFIPYVGVTIGLVTALLASLLDIGTRGAAPVLGVLATFAGVQLLDAVLITPRAVGGRIGLSAVGVIFSLSLGGTLLGYVGLLLAVPVAAVLMALIPRVLDAYNASSFYRGFPPPPCPANDREASCDE